MSGSHCVAIVDSRNGPGYVCFFDEPFGEQTPFELAGGYSVLFDSGIMEGGPIPTEDLPRGVDAWLEKNGWRRVKEAESLVQA